MWCFKFGIYYQSHNGLYLGVLSQIDLFLSFFPKDILSQQQMKVGRTFLLQWFSLVFPENWSEGKSSRSGSLQAALKAHWQGCLEPREKTKSGSRYLSQEVPSWVTELTPTFLDISVEPTPQDTSSKTGKSLQLPSPTPQPPGAQVPAHHSSPKHCPWVGYW